MLLYLCDIATINFKNIYSLYSCWRSNDHKHTNVLNRRPRQRFGLYLLSKCIFNLPYGLQEPGSSKQQRNHDWFYRHCKSPNVLPLFETSIENHQLQSDNLTVFCSLRSPTCHGHTPVRVSEIYCHNEFAMQTGFLSRGWLQIRWSTSAQLELVTGLIHNQGETVATIFFKWFTSDGTRRTSDDRCQRQWVCFHHVCSHTSICDVSTTSPGLRHRSL